MIKSVYVDSISIIEKMNVEVRIEGGLRGTVALYKATGEDVAGTGGTGIAQEKGQSLKE